MPEKVTNADVALDRLFNFASYLRMNHWPKACPASTNLGLMRTRDGCPQKNATHSIIRKTW